jgi:methionyl-tRNA formyltransferase
VKPDRDDIAKPVPGPIAVAASAAFGADVLERLAAQRDIAYLLSRPDRPRGRGRKPGPTPASETAKRLGIPVRRPERLDSSFDPQAPAVVVVAYGALVPAAVLDKALWLNVHPSLLPRWRGAAPVERALMAGDSKTGVTVHRTTAELDAGPLGAQRVFPIEPDDDAGTLYAKAAPIAAELIDEVLREPRFTPQPQDGVTYAEKLTAADRELDWSRAPEELERQVRALSPHIGARAELEGRPVIIWRARLAGDRLEPLEVQPEGRRRMSYEDFRRGLR